MRYKFLIFTTSIVLSLGLFCCYLIIPEIKPVDIDIVYINEVTKITEANLKDLNKAHYPQKKYEFDIVKTSRQDYDQEINDAEHKNKRKKHAGQTPTAATRAVLKK